MNGGEIGSGVSPRELLYSEDKIQLYRYLPLAGVKRNETPLLIVHALVNRPYVADLQENRSAINSAANAGGLL
ncbi:MAG: hypothetical protein ABW168_24695 [Sedimenticola sp.]